MKISLNLLLEELGYDLDRPHSSNPSFSHVEPFLLGHSPTSEGTLFISTLSEALLVPKKPDLFFLCVRNRMVDDIETDEALDGVFIVRRNMDQRELFIVVQRIFLRLRNWLMQMQVSVLNNRGMQDIMDLSESVIGNHISVLDSTYKLLAYTQHVETDDENLVQLMERGYHSEETVEKFRLHRRIEQNEMANEDDIIINADMAVSRFVTVKCVYKTYGVSQKSHFASVVMVCCSRPCTDGVVELFRMVLDNLRYYIDREKPVITGNTPVDTLFYELISKTLTNETEIRNRASYQRIPFEGFFELSVLVFDDNINTPVGHFIRELSLRLSAAKVISYGSDILVLNMYKNKDTAEDSKTNREYLKEILGDQNLCCGISNQFYSLRELSSAYEQARAAAVTGGRMRKARSDEEGISFYTFEDMFLHYLVSQCVDANPELLANCLAFRAVKTLRDYDEKQKTKLLQLLAIYLGSERNATITSTAMHMHRNTVLYHVGRIETLLGVRLDDENVRLKLLLGLKAHNTTQR